MDGFTQFVSDLPAADNGSELSENLNPETWLTNSPPSFLCDVLRFRALQKWLKEGLPQQNRRSSCNIQFYMIAIMFPPLIYYLFFNYYYLFFGVGGGWNQFMFSK